MSTILSLDLDILFSPYIGIYNYLIKDIDNYELMWKNIEQHFNIENFVLNESYFQIISNIINYYSSKIKKIYIGDDHGHILDVIEQLKKPNDQFIIHNIDYHHDILYNDEQMDKIKENLWSCADWVAYLNYYNYIDTYNWWQSPTSEFDKILLTNNRFDGFIPKNFIIHNFDDSFPLDLDIDIFYITLSLPWTPPQYYLIIQELLKNIDEGKIVFVE